MVVDSSRRIRFHKLLQPVHEAASRFCLRLCTTREDAEDLYHDAVLAAWHGLPGLKVERHFKPWFFRIITNTFRNQERRKRWRRWTSLATTEAPANDSSDSWPVVAVVDPRGALNARRWLDRAMAGLSAGERGLVVLFELEGYSVAEIAHILNVREGTVKSRLSRARTKMRAAITSFLSANKTETDSNREVAYALQPNHTKSE